MSQTAARGDAVINMASAAGIVPKADSGPHVAAKAGVIGLTKTAAIDTIHLGMKVDTVAPGWVRTLDDQSMGEDAACFARLQADAPIRQGAEP